jgi:ornithine cyclodeaminase/alanine dehydrogenase-like protein (mu-crystallin family)
MGNLLVLSDSEIHDILINLSREEIHTFRDAIIACLKDFSVGAERKYQPQPGVMNRPEGQRCLFRPFTSSESVGTKIVVQPAANSKAAGALHGMIAMCDADGLPSGILNAEEVTGYRTALSALIPWLWRRHTENIVVFGAGKQALWHLRLALALRGEEIKSIVVVNRTVSRANALLVKVKEENQRRWKSEAALRSIDTSRPDYQDVLKDHLSTAHAVFCTAGAKAPLFPANYITGEGRTRQPYISAVGSWQPDMIELDPELLRHLAAKRSQAAGSKAGSLLVDDRETVVPHTGELIQSKLDAEHIVELGEIADQQNSKDGGDTALQHWMEEGLLVYKSIGVGMTDLAASNAILAFARKKQLGTTISQF